MSQTKRTEKKGSEIRMTGEIILKIYAGTNNGLTVLQVLK